MRRSRGSSTQFCITTSPAQWNRSNVGSSSTRQKCRKPIRTRYDYARPSPGLRPPRALERDPSPRAAGRRCREAADEGRAKETSMATMTDRDEGLVKVYAAGVTLEGNLIVSPGATGIVLFAHGSGSSRFSSRNRYVAEVLRVGGLGTLLLDLLTPEEELVDTRTAHLRFDIELLADRLVGTIDWLARQMPKLKVGLFGASTGGGAALVAAARVPERIYAVVSRGGRPDLAAGALPKVQAPTLLIVGGNDTPVIAMNQEAYDRMTCVRRLEIIPGASHLFEEPGTLEQVSRMARDWFLQYLK